MSQFNWSRALLAGLAATIVMTVVMILTGMNLAKSLGSMLVGSNASTATQYAVGGTAHLMIGLIYGVIFGWLVGGVTEWNRFVKGTVYGLAIAAIAFAAMPLMGAMMGSGASKQAAANPCHSQTAMNPCHPQQAAMNPCHPQASMPMKSGTGNPCNPDSGGASPYGGLMSVVNHLIYGLTVAFVYGKAR